MLFHQSWLLKTENILAKSKSCWIEKELIFHYMFLMFSRGRICKWWGLFAWAVLLTPDEYTLIMNKGFAWFSDLIGFSYPRSTLDGAKVFSPKKHLFLGQPLLQICRASNSVCRQELVLRSK